MSWGMFIQIALLIVFYCFVKTFVRCMHDIHCKACKPKSVDECCK